MSVAAFAMPKVGAASALVLSPHELMIPSGSLHDLILGRKILLSHRFNARTVLRGMRSIYPDAPIELVFTWA